MKKRSMILALASMLGISAAATAVSGFAWFTTQRTATINESIYKVGAAEGSLKIEFTSDEKAWNCNPSVTTNVLTVNPAQDKALADVSSKDASEFRKVKFTAENNIKEIADETGRPAASGDWMSAVNNQQMVAVSWQLKVTNDGATDTEMDVMLSKTGALFVTNLTAEGSADYSEYFRMSISDGTDTVFTYTNASHKGFLDGTETFTTTALQTAALRGNGAYAASECMSGSLTSIVDASSSAYSKDADALPNNQKLIKGLGGGESKTLTFTVWCEGTATPESECLTNSVKTSMTLVGINTAA